MKGLGLESVKQVTRSRALVLAAQPQLHGFPWCLPPTVNDICAYAALKHQPFRQAKRHLTPALSAATKAQIWACRHLLTEYLVSVCYKIALVRTNNVISVWFSLISYLGIEKSLSTATVLAKMGTRLPLKA
uniref:Uncharacterized protein n=1 Tax=Peronospora matthiolae TaxID=2874970 RepID=A0AAV1TIG7_9STRA